MERGLCSSAPGVLLIAVRIIPIDVYDAVVRTGLTLNHIERHNRFHTTKSLHKGIVPVMRDRLLIIGSQPVRVATRFYNWRAKYLFLVRPVKVFPESKNSTGSSGKKKFERSACASISIVGICHVLKVQGKVNRSR